MLLLRGKEESGEAARRRRGSVQIDHVHISQLDADGGIRLLNAKCNSAALTGLIHIQKCHEVAGLVFKINKFKSSPSSHKLSRLYFMVL